MKYFFNVKNIEALRKLWKDESLYEDLRQLSEDYVGLEVGHSAKKKTEYKKKRLCAGI